ncbi:MAG: hypothetical protein KGL32_01575 [candidate division NC10 bacterium]|nr:hypothetical protein [candidate division NC10 bacterium]
MSTEELKLYLLLLVSTVRIGEEGQIVWEVVKRGLGESLTVEKIGRLGEALGRHGLARVRVTYPPEVGGRERGDAAPVVYSTVFGLERLRGPASRGRRRGREKGDG